MGRTWSLTSSLGVLASSMSIFWRKMITTWKNTGIQWQTHQLWGHKLCVTTKPFSSSKNELCWLMLSCDNWSFPPFFWILEVTICSSGVKLWQLSNNSCRVCQLLVRIVHTFHDMIVSSGHRDKLTHFVCIGHRCLNHSLYNVNISLLIQTSMNWVDKTIPDLNFNVHSSERCVNTCTKLESKQRWQGKQLTWLGSCILKTGFNSGRMRSQNSCVVQSSAIKSTLGRTNGIIWWLLNSKHNCGNTLWITTR